MSDVELKSLLVPEKTVTMEFDPEQFPGFKVDLCHISREELSKLAKSSTVTKFSRKTRQPEETLDNEKFTDELLKRTVKGWTGLKYKYLEELLLVDTSSLESLDGELAYTETNLKTLISNSTEFDQWVSEESSNLANFTKSK